VGGAAQLGRRLKLEKFLILSLRRDHTPSAWMGFQATKELSNEPSNRAILDLMSCDEEMKREGALIEKLSFLD
jgi:hypothetical protein